MCTSAPPQQPPAPPQDGGGGPPSDRPVPPQDRPVTLDPVAAAARRGDRNVRNSTLVSGPRGIEDEEEVNPLQNKTLLGQ